MRQNEQSQLEKAIIVLLHLIGTSRKPDSIFRIPLVRNRGFDLLNNPALILFQHVAVYGSLHIMSWTVYVENDERNPQTLLLSKDEILLFAPWQHIPIGILHTDIYESIQVCWGDQLTQCNLWYLPAYPCPAWKL
jgi:hypothetical protein